VRERATHGVATETDVQIASSLVLQADLAARLAERREVTATRRLAGLLSLAADLHGTPLVDPLPDPVAALADREALVEHGRSTRLDLAALASAVRGAEARLELERQRAAPDLTVGVGYERPESDDPTDHVLGPVLSVELPVFDRSQAAIARADSELQSLRKLQEALLAELGQQVRAAADEATLAADAVRFVLDELLPQAERSAALAREAYGLGDTTILPMLEAERTLSQARATGVEAELDAALALVELERAVGGPLPGGGGEN
jgi:cobalt-zinc-cadmium efflux system outer membrane protein